MADPILPSISLDDLDLLSNRASSVIDRLRDQVFAPGTQKNLDLRFNVRTAAQMIGRSETLIRDAENEGRLPTPEKDDKTGRRKGYSLHEINNMREIFGTLPYRAPDDEALVLAVQNFKGGVGKSTTSVNLALALAAEGAKVGILDADIYGPSQPRMLGTTQRPESADGKSIEPIESFGIQSMSMGFLIEEEEPMIWRGPMVTQALQQMLGDTNWKDLDYMVIDLPPGTGDIQLTLSQKVPVSGAVIVTTPQDISLLDARKALKMFEKVNVPVLGIVENMSTHICSNCGHEEHIFGAGGGDTMAQQYDVDMLGNVPLDIKIREGADSGHPTVVSDPDSDITLSYRTIAHRITAHLAKQGKDYSGAFPNIVIKND